MMSIYRRTSADSFQVNSIPFNGYTYTFSSSKFHFVSTTTTAHFHVNWFIENELFIIHIKKTCESDKANLYVEAITAIENEK